MKTSKFSTNKKIMTAASMLLLSTFMLSSATYAWFTMNKSVEVTGMQLKTTVSSNLLVSPDTAEANFQPAIAQARSALLEPVSTINGVDYDFTLNAAANGAALANATFETYNEDTNLTAADTFADKTKYDDDFNTRYSISTANPASAAAFQTAYGYVDYAFYLKATNTESSTATIVMDKCNLLYNGETIGEKAWRTALFVKDLGATVSTGVMPGAEGGATLKTFLAPDQATNQSSGQARNSSHTLANLPTGTATVDATLASGATKYYFVVVRVWLEGEDTTCTSETYATLTNAWTLDIGFSMESTAQAVTIIDSVPAANP